MEINKTKLNKIFCWLSLAICGLIMLASAVITKSPFMNDSSGFINMSVIRDPLYPLFLLLFRTVFGDTLYIPVVQVLQSLFDLMLQHGKRLQLGIYDFSVFLNSTLYQLTIPLDSFLNYL